MRGILRQVLVLKSQSPCWQLICGAVLSGLTLGARRQKILVPGQNQEAPSTLSQLHIFLYDNSYFIHYSLSKSSEP